ncbi:MAG: hypothetical protein FD154_1091 [Elusimicrobia bacterium]|nr:MAG: hypothetical protein FD154_1091 [Elusimicrobiota bacterium]
MRPTGERTLAGHMAALGRKVFTSRELAAVSGRSGSVVSQGLAFLARQGQAVKIGHGLWAAGAGLPGQYEVVPYLLPKQRVYVSFTSALHLHGVVGQIPQVVTLASTSHSRALATRAGNFVLHHLAPGMFRGFEWDAGRGFPLASPEKALVDCLYISAFRKKRFSYFPELDLSGLDRKKAAGWAAFVKNPMARAHVLKRLAELRRP